MAGIELATAYVSIVPSTDKLAKELTGPKAAAIGQQSGQAMGDKASVAFGKSLVGALSVAAVANFAKTSVQAFADAEASAALLKQAVDNTGVSYEDYAKKIDTLVQKQSYMAAFDDEVVADALRTLTITTGDTDQAMDLLSLTTDFARAKNMDLVSSAELIGKVAAGNLGILSRYGIVLEDGATATEALAAIQEKVAGAGQAYGDTTAGTMERWSIAMENFQEAVGANLAPAAAVFIEEATKMVNKFGELPASTQVAILAIAGVEAALALIGWQAALLGAIGFASYMATTWVMNLTKANDAIDRTIARLEKLIGTASDASGKLGGGFSLGDNNSTPSYSGRGYSSTGKVGAYANGGIVTSPTLALIGEAGPEAVVPLSGSAYNFSFSNTRASDIPSIKNAVTQMMALSARPGMA